MKNRRFVRATFLLPVAILIPISVHATGYFGPTVYLDEGGRKVAASPEFFWELETKRLARNFHPPEKMVAPQGAESEADEEMRVILNRQTSEADKTDFAEALKSKRLSPPDAAAAMQQHEAARQLIETTDANTSAQLGAEFPSEFADYQRGAFAYRRGPEHWAEARAAWEALLHRPEQERHYRTVWAAFMLGKLALKEKDPKAVEWFQRTRALAAAGFADSLGMAAASYGWEGRSEWKQGYPEKAAPLFLTQLSLGEESAIVSLKALIPDREPVEGMLNYGPEPEAISSWTDEQKKNADDAARTALKRAAQDPLLRRLVTVHILATASAPNDYDPDRNRIAARSARWLAMINDLKLNQLEDAEYVGWVAYNSGDYKSAARWLELADPSSPAACWLRAKLQSRAGKISEAAQSMAQAWQSVRDVHAYTGWQSPTNAPEDYSWDQPHFDFSQSAAGDLGAFHLERSDFVQSLDTLLNGRLWNDAAFVAERVLTLPELQKYVDDHPPETNDRENLRARLRYLLGRRMVREDREEEAVAYLPSPYNEVLKRYLDSLGKGHDSARPKNERARALFAAAWLARYDGMELMGTEGAPDGFAEEGSFPFPDLAGQFQSGTYQQVTYTDGEEKQTRVPIWLQVQPPLRERLTKNKIVPDLRYHYRVVAGALALQAAKLLPNDSEELADVLNHAGLWVKDEDEKLGNQYYKVIEGRARRTVIGRKALARHWFVDQNGPWSEEQQQAHDALRKELHFPEDQ